MFQRLLRRYGVPDPIDILVDMLAERMKVSTSSPESGSNQWYKIFMFDDVAVHIHDTTPVQISKIVSGGRAIDLTHRQKKRLIEPAKMILDQAREGDKEAIAATWLERLTWDK